MLDNNVFIERINKKSRLIGIDPGGKRIGIAISDENKIVATPYATLIRENYADLLAKIKKIIDDNQIEGIVIGNPVNMDGTALYECAGVLFIAQAQGIPLDSSQQFVVVITALLASIGAAGIPSAGLVMLFIVTDAVGLSSDAVAIWVGSMLAIDRPLDMFRTMVNISSDSVGVAVIAKSEGEDLY